MKKLVSFLLLILTSLQVYAQPQISVSVDKQSVVPGEQVNIEFTAMTSRYFTDSPQFSLPYLANAMVKQEKKSVTSGFSFIDDKKYTSQRWSIQVYPNKQGVYLIPSMKVTLTTAGEGLQSVITHLETAPIALTVKSPVAMKGQSGYLVSPAVTINDEWSFDEANTLKRYNKGDVVQRTITVKAEQTSTFMMPDFVPSVEDGVSVSLFEPQLSSDYLRGEHSATLIQRISYSIDKPGQYTFGNEQVTWWNPELNKSESWQASKFSIDAGGIDYHGLLLWTLGFIGALIILWFVRLVWFKCSPVVLKLKRLLFGYGPDWLNLCYLKADRKSTSTIPLLTEASSNKALVRHSMQRQFEENKSIGKWQRIRVYLSLKR